MKKLLRIGTTLAVLLLLLSPVARLSAQTCPELSLRIGGGDLGCGCSYHYGHVARNTTADLTLTVANTGHGDLTVSNLDLPAGPFALVAPPATPFTIAAGGSIDLTVRFSPDASCFQCSELLTIGSDDADEGSCTVNLRGTAVDQTQAGKTLLINEFSNGPSGNLEYMEFVVAGAPGQCRDLRGWIIDDNSGRGTACGAGFSISAGHIRFTTHAQWANVKAGSVILIYNGAAKNTSITAADDWYDTNADGVYVIPISNNVDSRALFETNTVNPSATTCDDFTGSYVALVNTSWANRLGLGNTGDLVQVIDPANTAVAHHSVAYGTLANIANADVNIPLTGAGMVYRFNDLTGEQRPFDSAAWERLAVAGNETPGTANGADNQVWLDAFQVEISACAPAACANMPVFLTTNAYRDGAGGTVHDWDFEDDSNIDVTTNSADNSASVTATYASAASPTIRLTVNGGAGCQTTVTTNVVIGAQPALTVSDDDVCLGQGVTLFPTSGFAEYRWFPTTSLSDACVEDPTANPVTSTTYTVYATDAAGCTNSAQATIAVHDPQVVLNPAGPLTLCQDAVQNLEATGSDSFTWSPATDLDDPNIATPTLTATTLGTRTYTVTGTTAGCTATSSITVTVNGNPTVSIAPVGPLTFCVGSTQTLTASGATTYSWSPATDLSATNVAAPVLTAATPGTRTYTVTGSDGNGCSNTASITVTVNANPTVSIAPVGPLALCVGSTQTLTASGATTYSWSPATDLSATNVAAPVLTAATLGTRTYTVTGTDGNGCSNTAGITVTVNGNPTVSIAPVGPLTFCVGSTQTLTASGATTYSWSPATDLSATNVTAPVLTAATPGTRTYTVTGSDGNGCSNTASITVTVNANPTVSIAPVGPLALCVGSTQTLTASGATTYSWSPATDLSATNVAAPVLTAATLGTRTYTVTGSDGNGCSNTASIAVTVNANPTVSIAPVGPLTFCVGSTQTLTASGATTYSWSPATDLSATNVAAPVLTAATPGTRTYTVTGTDGNGCSNTASIAVTVNANPTVSIAPVGPLALCVGSTQTLTASGANTYAWSPATDLSATNIAAPVLTAATLGTRTYTVTGADGNGCSNTASIAVTVNANPTVSIAPVGPLTLCVGATQTLTASGATTYAWSPATDLSATNVAAPVLTAATLGTRTYTVTGSDGNGCSNTASITVTVNGNPTVTAVSDFATLCIDGTARLQAGGATSYVWTPATALSSTTIANPVATLTAPGTLTWTVTGTTAGCTNSASVSVTVNDCRFNFDCTNDTYTQNFDSWNPTTPTANTCAAGDNLPSRWNDNNSVPTWYVAVQGGAFRFNSNDGSCNTGGMYAFGNDGSGERALGTNRGGSTMRFGAQFVNNTAAPVTDLIIDYVGEQWRRGGAAIGSPDRLDFQYSVNATALNAGTWINVNQLDFNSPNTGPASNVQINPPATQALNFTITGLNIAPGAAFWIRWNDFNLTGGSDGLGVDDFRMTVNTVAQPTSVTVGTPRCQGVDLTLTANPAPPANIQYRWFDVPTGGVSLGTGQNYVVTAPAAGTYTYYVEAFNTVTGCVSRLARRSVTFTVNPLPTVGATATPDVICVGATSQFTANGASTYAWTPATDLSNAAIFNPVFTASVAGTITYTVTGTDANGCANTAVATVTVNPRPNVTATATPASICFDGSTSQLQGGGAVNFSWSPASNLNSVAIFNPVFTPPSTGSFTYTVTGTDANGCTNTASTTVTVNTPPTVTASANPNPVCVHATSQFTAAGANTYLWTPATNLDNPAIFNPIYDPSSPGTFNYTVRGTDVNGCTNTAQISVVVNSAPTVTAVAAPPTLCFDGSATQFSAGGAVSYQWSPAANLDNASIGTPIFIPPSAGSFTYTVTGTDANGCSNSASVTVTVNPVPTVNASATPNILCFDGSTSQFDATGATTYAWTPATDLSNAAIFNPVFTPSAPGTFTYTVTGTDGNGCTNSTSIMVTVNALPNVTATATPPAICFDGSTSQLQGNGANTYVWTPATDLSNAAIANPVFTPSASGSFTYTVTGTDGNGCANTASVTVTVNDLPTIDATATPDEICIDGTSQLEAVGGVSYVWTPAADLSSATIFNPVFTPSAVGNFSYTVRGTDANGCTNTIDVSITVNALPTVTASATPGTICLEETSQFSASGAVDYVWTPATDLDDDQVFDPVFTPSAPGTFTYTVTGTDANGCANTAEVTVTVRTPPTVGATATPAAICFDGSTSQLEGTGADTYVWTPAADLDDDSIFNPVFTPSASGTATFTVTGTDVNGCANTAEVTVTVNDLPTIDATATPDEVCIDATSQLEATGGVSYVWSPAANLSNSTIFNPVFTPAAIGPVSYTVMGTDANGCTNTVDVAITVHGLPTIGATATPDEICLNATSQFEATGAVNYVWTPAANLDDDQVFDPVFTPTAPGAFTYTVTGTDANGCANTAEVTVTVNPLPTVATLATPAVLCIDGGTSQLQASGANTYVWNPAADLNDPAIFNPVFTPPGAGTFTYTVTGTDGNGCANTASVTVTVHPLPTITATATPDIICRNGTSQLEAAGGINYNWSPPTDLSSTTIFNPVFTASAPGTFTYTVVGTDANACANTAEVTITVNDLPPVTATATPGAICLGTTSQFTAGGANTYIWTPATNLSNPAIANPVFTSTAAGSFTYTVTGTDAAGCTNSASLTITVNPPPTITATATPSTICFDGSTSQFSATGSSVSYVWTPGIGLSDPSIGNPIFFAFNPGVFDYTVTGTDANGCTNSATVTITVLDLPTLTATATPDEICFDGSTSQFDAAGTVLSFTWTPAADLSDAAIANPVFTPSAPGVFNYTVSGDGANGCTNAVTVTITVNALPTVTATATPSTICLDGSTSQLDASGADVYTWTPAIGLSDPAIFNPVFTPAGPGNFSFDVEGVDVNGCRNTATVSVTVNPQPTVTASATLANFCLGGSTAVTAGGANTFSWQPAAEFNLPLTFNPTLTPAAPGANTYTVTGTDANGCTNSAGVTVTVTNCTFAFDCANDSYFQDFNNWDTTTPTANTCAGGDNLPEPWNDGNTIRTWYVDLQNGAFQFNSSDGSCGFGGMYAFGNDGSGERALGSNRGGSTFRFGAQFTNNTGAPITDLVIDYMGEQWRRGSGFPGNPDRLEFQYSTDATSLNTGTWTNHNPLDFVSPNTGPLLNVPINPPATQAVASVITGLNIAPGAAFWVRWNDFNLAGGNDGLAVDDFRMVVNTVAQPTSVSTSMPLCDGVDVTLTANPAPPANIEYRWYDVPTGGVALGTGPTFTLTAPAADVYTFYVEAANTATGCVSRVPRTPVTFTVNNLPVITASATPNVLCFDGSTSQLEGFGAIDFVWTPNANLNNDLVFNPIFTPAGPGTTTFTVEGTDANGCRNTATVSVTVNALPVLNVTATPGLINIAETSQLQVTGAQTYIWNNASRLNNPSIDNPVFTPDDCGNYTITVTGTDANGCVNTAQIAVNVVAAPITASANPPAVCIGGCTNVSATSVFGGYTYTWANPAVTVPIFNTCPTTTTAFNVTANYLNCTINGNVVVPVNPLPTVTVNPNTLVDLCAGESQIYTAGGALTYTWQPIVDLNAAIGPVVTLTGSLTGTRTYTVLGTDGNGCTNTATFMVNVRPVPTVTATPLNASTCLGGVIQMTASGAATYQWNPGTDLTATNVSAPTLIATTVGTRTYTVTGTAGNGCTNSASSTITVNPLPNVTIVPAGPITICQFGTQQLTASGAVNYAWAPAQYLSTTGGVTTTFTGTDPGNYAYTVVGTDANGCQNVSAPVAITVNAAPTVTIAPPGPLNLCVGNQANMAAAGANTYFWTPATDLNVTNSATPTLTAASVGTRTYTVIGTAVNGCTNTATIQVQVTPSPVVAVTPVGPISLCPGQTRTLSASGALSYVWSPATDLSSATAASPLLTAATVGTRTYTVTGTAPNGCTHSATLQVTVNATPAVTAAHTPTEICAGSTANLTAGGATTYVWEPGTVAGANITVAPPVTTTYTVRGTDGNGCTASAVTQVIVNQLPSLPFTPPVTVCAGTPATIQPPALPGVYRFFDAATGGNQIGAGASYITPPLNAGTFTYFYSYRDLNGCEAIGRQPVTVFVENVPQTIGPIQGTNLVCAFKESTHFVNNLPGVGYEWFGLPTGASIVSGQGTNSVQINWGFASLGLHTISVRPTYFCGPGLVESVQVEIIDRPARPLSLTGPTTACLGQSTTYTLSTRPGETYQWRVSPAAAMSATGNTATFTWGVPGTYVVEGRAVNQCGASLYQSIPVTVATPVTANGGFDQTTCGTSAVLRAVNPSPGTGVWSFANGPSTPGIVQSGTSLFISGLTSLGTYEFDWTVTSGGCPPQTSRIRVFRIGPPATPTVNSPTIGVCDQSTADIQFVPATDGVGTWSFLTGPVPATISQSGSVSGMTATGVYTFRYTVTNTCGSQFVDATITRDGTASLVFAGADQSLCSSTSTLLIGSALPTGFTAQWSFINGPPSAVAGITTFGRYGSVVDMTAEGVYSFQYSVSGPFGICAAKSDVVQITRRDRPTTAVVQGPTQICGSTVVLQGNIPTIGNAAWSFVSGPMAPNLNPQSETLTASGMSLPGLYTFRWTVSNPPCTPSAYDHTVEVGIESIGGSAAASVTEVCEGENSGFVQLQNYRGVVLGWEVATDPNFAGSFFVSTNSPSYVFSNLTSATYIRARVQEGVCPPALSNTVAINVLPSNLSLDLGPDRQVCGDNLTQMVVKSHPNLQVTWRILSQPANSAALILPGDSEAFISSLKTGTYFIEVTTETPCGSAQDVIQIDVQTQTQPGAVLASRNECAGANAAILQLSGHSGQILRWESSVDDWATVVTLTNTTSQQGYNNLTQTTAFRAVVGGGVCPEANSAPAVITVFQSPVANAGPDQQVCSDGFVLTGNSVSGATSSWTQVSGPATLPVAVSGNLLTAANVSVSGAYVFRYTLDNGVCPASSDLVQVTVGSSEGAGFVTGDAVVCAGSNFGEVNLSAYNGTIVRWESSTDNWQTVVTHGNTTPVFNYFNLTTTTQFRAVVNTPACPNVTTNHATVLVNQAPTTAAAPARIDICSDNVILTGNAPIVGTGQWYFVFGPAQANIASAGQTAFVTGLTANGSYLFEYRIENAPCEPSVAYTIVTVGSTVAAPTGLNLVSVSATQAQVSWTGVPNTAGYIVEWSDASTGFTVWKSAMVCNPNTSYLITNLTAGLGHRVRVRTNCTSCPVTLPSDRLSAFTPTLQFITPASRQGAELEMAADFAVYPNPNDGRFVVSFTAETAAEARLELYDLAGQRVHAQTVPTQAGSNEAAVELQDLSAGVYLLRLTRNGATQTAKVVLN